MNQICTWYLLCLNYVNEHFNVSNENNTIFMHFTTYKNTFLELILTLVINHVSKM